MKLAGRAFLRGGEAGGVLVLNPPPSDGNLSPNGGELPYCINGAGSGGDFEIGSCGVQAPIKEGNAGGSSVRVEGDSVRVDGKSARMDGSSVRVASRASRTGEGPKSNLAANGREASAASAIGAGLGLSSLSLCSFESVSLPSSVSFGKAFLDFFLPVLAGLVCLYLARGTRRGELRKGDGLGVSRQGESGVNRKSLSDQSLLDGQRSWTARWWSEESWLSLGSEIGAGGSSSCSGTVGQIASPAGRSVRQ